MKKLIFTSIYLFLAVSFQAHANDLPRTLQDEEIIDLVQSFTAQEVSDKGYSKYEFLEMQVLDSDQNGQGQTTGIYTLSFVDAQKENSSKVANFVCLVKLAKSNQGWDVSKASSNCAKDNGLFTY